MPIKSVFNDTTTNWLENVFAYTYAILVHVYQISVQF